ncbi:gas vesicle accessory protein GvpU [Janthinobacterium sp. SUN120]|uniref:gas vesicle accessory protein GvpU n=1 Tax=Janthinobacterium sp. SUN120 TaxID=3004099 RepID=UPI0025B11F29|nr:gas vesicle accessory protein GvpU [Janthinobacterium sp. SUN120]MDN2716866.1 hypothetical protein [Janthinobacterium sp. SUN120]
MIENEISSAGVDSAGIKDEVLCASEVDNSAFPAHLQKPDQDRLLQELVKHANDWGLSISITLNLGGSMVSGQLISVETYLDEFAAEFKASFKDNPEIAQSYFDLFSSYKPKRSEAEDKSPITPARYIHLQGVRTYAPGRPQFSVTSNLWRGRISEVSGFFIGMPPLPNSN